MPDLADQAYGHCLAVTGSSSSAADAASTALRRGGWSRTAVLGHAAHLAVRAAGPGPADDGPSSGADLVGLARWLASTRPATERAVLDLADRHGFGTDGLARAVGGGAASRLAAAAAGWEEALDPALMAWLGPGSCAELARVLGHDTGEGPAEPDPGEPGPGADQHPPAPLSAREALALAPRVAAHLEGCAPCSDRRRAMVSVRSILARDPIPAAPAGVRAVARASWRRPVPLPAPPLTGSRPLPWRRAVVAVPVVLAAGAVAYLAWPSDGGPVSPSPAAIDALTRLPAGGSSLALAGAEVAGDRGQVTLLNVGARALTWRAASSAAWLTVSPATGRLEARHYTVLTLAVSSAPAVGALRATVSVSGDDGSAATSTLTVGPPG